MDVGEIERLHFEATRPDSRKILTGKDVADRLATKALAMYLRDHLPEIIAKLKAADGLRDELAEYACAGFDKCPKYGTSNECERRMMALECGDDARKAILAYDTAVHGDGKTGAG